MLFLFIVLSVLLIGLLYKTEHMTNACTSAGVQCSEDQLKQLNNVLNIVQVDIKKKQLDNTDTYIDGKRVATPEDFEKAWVYAKSKMCVDKGYTYIPDDEGGVCAHTYDTCMRDSVKSGNDFDFKYLEWRGAPNSDELNRCVYAYSGYRKRCEDAGLTYNETEGSCKTNKKYCLCYGLEFKNNDCWKNPLQVGFSHVVGETVVHSLHSHHTTKPSCTKLRNRNKI